MPMPDGDWEWGGCGDNVHFGYRKSRDFMDARPSGRHGDIKTLVRLHNNDAGRLVSYKSDIRYFEFSASIDYGKNSITGHKRPHAFRVQMPRVKWFLYAQDLLDENASISGRGKYT